MKILPLCVDLRTHDPLCQYEFKVLVLYTAKNENLCMRLLHTVYQQTPVIDTQANNVFFVHLFWLSLIGLFIQSGCVGWTTHTQLSLDCIVILTAE
jgi:hypothetical protein